MKNRPIRFRAFIKPLNFFLDDITIYPTNLIGIDDGDFEEQLPEEFEFTDTTVTRVSDGAFIMELMVGEEWLWIEGDHFDLVQFTGLVDKNGEDIYEGHWVKVKFAGIYIMARIIYNDSAAEFQIEYPLMISTIDAVNTYVSDHLHMYINDIEIVGNVFQNLEFPQPLSQ